MELHLSDHGYNLTGNLVSDQETQNDSALFLGTVGNGTFLNDDSDGMSQEDFYRYQRHLWNVQLYLTPIIIFVGLIGNITSFFVFVTTSLRHLSSSVYLAALALTDSGFLFQLLFVWLNYVRVFIMHSPGWCQTVVYLTYVCSFLSVWFVVSFTVERYIAVVYPLKRQDMCIVPRARKVVLCLSAFGIVAYSFGAWTSGVQEVQGISQCLPLTKFTNLINIANNIDTFVTLLIPSLAIFIMNIRIILKIAYFYDKRSGMTVTFSRGEYHRGSNSDKRSKSISSSVDLKSGSVASSVEPHSSPRNRSQMKITKLLLVVSTVFLLLNLPSHAIRVYFFFMGYFKDSWEPSNSLVLWQQIFTIIYYCNFSVNFFLYSLCGKNFRKALCHMMKNAYYKICTKCCCRYRPVFVKDLGRREAASVGTQHSFILRTASNVSKNVDFLEK